MKKRVLLASVFLAFALISYGQDISDVSQSGNTLVSRDEKNNYIAQMSFSGDYELCGFSQHMIVVRQGTTLVVYDQKFNYIAQRSLSSGEKVKNVNGNNIIIRSGSTIVTYDKKFNYLSQRSE